MAKFNNSRQNRGNQNERNRNAPVVEVVSNYNFVPAPEADQVYTVDWADQVSHDIPFSDGQSGEIEIEIEAKTPIFIRNGHAEGEEDNTFSHITLANGEKKYFIPASSIKGMLRNTLEIMSLSKMNEKLVNDHRHAVRQVMKRKDDVIDEKYTLGNNKLNIFAGWLIKNGNEISIYECGKPFKIRYTDLDNKLTTNFIQFSNPIESFDLKTAKYKYENILNGKELVHNFEKHPLDEEGQKSWISRFQPLDYVKFCDTESDFGIGTIVCSGQATPYTVDTSRKGEYVFNGKKEDIIKDESKKREVTKEVFENFLFINRDDKPENEILVDWKFWKQKLKNGIPVFFRKKDNKVIDFGLTFMYKEPVKYSVKDLLPKYDKNIKDLAEVLFGYTDKEQSLKGRVFISNFVSENAEEEEEKSIVQASPKSSYTPFYLVQDYRNNGNVNNFNTYNLANSKIRGFKKYPVHYSTKPHKPEDGQKEMTSKFKPLKEGSIFKGKIRFFNLRKAELGALLSSLTFHGMSLENENLFFNIGYAKPRGYGRVLIKIKFEKIEEYVKHFELEMRSKFSNWNNSEAIKELFSMSILNDATENKLKYLELKNFQILKNKGLTLLPYSQITKNFNKIELKLYANQDELDNFKKVKENQKLEFAKKQNEAALAQEQAIAAEEIEYQRVLTEGSVQEIDAMLQKYTFGERAEALANRKTEIIEEARIQAEALAEEVEYQKALITEDLDLIKKYIEENPFRVGIEEVRRRYNQLKPTEIPIRLKEGKIPFKNFIKEAKDWKKKSPDAFDALEKELEQLCLKNYKQKLEL